MKKIPFFLLVGALFANSLLTPAPRPVSAQAQTERPVVLCLPGVYPNDPGDCVPAGPSSYLGELAQHGILLPMPAMASTPVDPDLGRVPFRYGEVRNNNAPVYGTLEDAMRNRPRDAVRRMVGDFMWISYADERVVDGKRYFNIGPNAWMTGNDITRLGVLPQGRALIFERTPAHAFGWALPYWVPEPLQTKRTPGTAVKDYTGRILNLYEIVPLLGEELVGEELWVRVGPEEWAPKRYIARVLPNSTPPAGVEGGRWIEINLLEQTLMAYDNYQLVFATIIASGIDPFWTRPGLFQIFSKLETTPMTGATTADRSDAYYLEDVPWTMYYDGAIAIHGAYWRAKMGFVQSHGCVNMAIADAHWLFKWAVEGDWVYVWDPSGKTPTDPSLYGPGGY